MYVLLYFITSSHRKSYSAYYFLIIMGCILPPVVQYTPPRGILKILTYYEIAKQEVHLCSRCGVFARRKRTTTKKGQERRRTSQTPVLVPRNIGRDPSLHCWDCGGLAKAALNNKRKQRKCTPSRQVECLSEPRRESRLHRHHYTMLARADVAGRDGGAGPAAAAAAAEEGRSPATTTAAAFF